MAVQPTYPGVYVQEVPSGVRTIVGVSTSVAAFVGRTEHGPLDKPIQCLNYSTFKTAFGENSVNPVSDMARYVKLFFANGGSNCHVLRIANGATYAKVTLHAEAPGNPQCLDLEAKIPGKAGEEIRAVVDYNTTQPEATFNLTLFRWEADAAGRRQRVDLETHRNLSMDPVSATFVQTLVTQQSRLVKATVSALAPAATAGVSRSGVLVPHTTAAQLRNNFDALMGANGTGKFFELSVGGSDPVRIDLSGLDVSTVAAPNVGAFRTNLAGAITAAITPQLTLAGITGQVTAAVQAGPSGPGANRTSYLQLAAVTAGEDLRVRPDAGAADLAVPLRLGTDQGGVEIGAHAVRRPAPNGITWRATDPNLWLAFGELQDATVNQIAIESLDPAAPGTVTPVPLPSVPNAAPARIFVYEYATPPAAPPPANPDGSRQKLERIRKDFNKYADDNPGTFKWRAQLWGWRLALLPTDAPDNQISTALSTTGGGGTDLTAIPIPGGGGATVNAFTINVHRSSVGAQGNSTGLQTSAAAAASDGSAPTAADYQAAYRRLDKLDIFNLLLLPPDSQPAAGARQEDLWGAASVFCQKRRAFLLMDAPRGWDSPQTALNGNPPAVPGIGDLRTGLVKDYAAIYYPRLMVDENGLRVAVGASGAIAGLMARIDGSRGVWREAAGTLADLRGIRALDLTFSDDENGLLNPEAINTVRAFPDGIVNWGARTMLGYDSSGESDYKYVAVRRTALFIEESLFRGLKWAVFEPNAEPLWAEIRLAVGAFMHNLFRKGAFKGQTPGLAYDVKCDAETTTQNDINLGIVNIWVRFAPLKPAEFVILYIQQLAGQIAA